MRGPSDGELIGGTLVLVDCTSKLRLGLLIEENTERNFCLNPFLGNCSLFEGVDMAKGFVIDGWKQVVYICLYNPIGREQRREPFQFDRLEELGFKWRQWSPGESCIHTVVEFIFTDFLAIGRTSKIERNRPAPSNLLSKVCWYYYPDLFFLLLVMRNKY